MAYKLGNICHIEIAGGNLGKSKKFYSKLFGWKFNPMNKTYEFFDAGNATGAIDADAKPSKNGTILVLACKDIDAKLTEIVKAGGRIIKGKTEIGGYNSYYAYFQDLAGNRMGVWAPKK